MYSQNKLLKVLDMIDGIDDFNLSCSAEIFLEPHVILAACFVLLPISLPLGVCKEKTDNQFTEKCNGALSQA